MSRKEIARKPQFDPQDPFALMRQMTSELDQLFEDFPLAMPRFRGQPLLAPAGWLPQIEVFEADNQLVTKVDLPGMKKEDVKVEVTDGHLVISGERKSETEEKMDRFYRSERQYGKFSRTIPLPEGVKLEDVKATFADGVLEVSVPLPAKPEATVHKIEVQDGTKAVKSPVPA